MDGDANILSVIVFLLRFLRLISSFFVLYSLFSFHPPLKTETEDAVTVASYLVCTSTVKTCHQKPEMRDIYYLEMDGDANLLLVIVSYFHFCG